jgi:hypothetical protein
MPRHIAKDVKAKIVSLRKMGLSLHQISHRMSVKENTCQDICEKAGLKGAGGDAFVYAEPETYTLSRGTRWQRSWAEHTWREL